MFRNDKQTVGPSLMYIV